MKIEFANFYVRRISHAYDAERYDDPHGSSDDYWKPLCGRFEFPPVSTLQLWAEAPISYSPDPRYNLCYFCACKLTPYRLVQMYFGEEVTEEEAEYFLWNSTAWPLITGETLRAQIEKMHERSGGDIKKSVQIAYEDLDKAMEEYEGKNEIE